MPIIDITTHPAGSHANPGYSPDPAHLAVVFDYVDTYAEFADQPVVMLAFLYPHGRGQATSCELGHDVAADEPIVDIPDITFCFMCPRHFHDSSAD